MVGDEEREERPASFSSSQCWVVVGEWFSQQSQELSSLIRPHLLTGAQPAPQLRLRDFLVKKIPVHEQTTLEEISGQQGAGLQGQNHESGAFA